MKRIDIKLGLTMILLLVSILLPLGFVINQIFYGFYISQAQETTLSKSIQYASIINESKSNNPFELIEVATKVSKQKFMVIGQDGEVLVSPNFVFSNNDIAILFEKIKGSNSKHYMTNSFKSKEGTTYIVSTSPIEVNQFNGHVVVFTTLEIILKSIKTVQNLLILSAVGSLLLGVGLTYLISRKLSQPLVDMERVAREIAKGKLDTRIENISNDELGSLAIAINDLAIELNQVNEQRREFFANISHELRTPITYLKGYSRVLREGLWSTEEERVEYLNIIEHEASRLTLLVNDLFDLAKMEEGGFHLNLSEVDLNEILKILVNKTTYKASEKGIIIKYDFKPIKDEITIIGDPLRIEQIFGNLLDNAIRYTNNGSIKITLLNERNYVQIEIEDTGIGIEAEELPFIFKRFYRVEKSRSREYGGTGLGLAIVKQLLELHKGTIRVKSTIGKGTKFTIRFPKIMI